MSHLFTFGLGYAASRIADQLKRESWRVFGTTRDEKKAAALQRHGFETQIYNASQPLDLKGLTWATHILSTIPPDKVSDPLLTAHMAEIAKIAPRLKWIGYLSSSAVYGDRKGEWVDEATPCYLASATGEARIQAEKQWLSLPLQAHIFRLSGIYGPGRSVLDELKAGTAQRIDKPGHVFNRIHIDDVVQAVVSSIKHPYPGKIYNINDDEPASRADVVTYGAELLGIEPPPVTPVAEAQLSPQLQVFYGECKRVKNERMKKDLNITLKYPTYREGLQQMVGAQAAKSG